MSKTNYNTNRVLAQVVFWILGSGAVVGSIWIICRIAHALLALAGVA